MWKAGRSPSNTTFSIFLEKETYKCNLSVVMIGIWIMCWLSLRNAGHLTVSPFLCLSKAEILGFDIPFLLGSSLVFPISSVTLHKAKAERRSCRPVKPCDRSTYFPPSISILAMCVTAPSGTNPTARACWSICLSCHSSGLWLQSQICLVSPACWCYLLSHCTSDSHQNSSTQTCCPAASGTEQGSRGSVSWSHQC